MGETDLIRALHQSLHTFKGDNLNCPNCGAPITEETCPYCGTLFVDFAAMDADKPFFLKVKHNGEVYIFKVKMGGLSVTTETADWCELGSIGYRSVVLNTNLAIDFTLV